MVCSWSCSGCIYIFCANGFQSNVALTLGTFILVVVIALYFKTFQTFVFRFTVWVLGLRVRFEIYRLDLGIRFKV